jgi:hypothetical protein
VITGKVELLESYLQLQEQLADKEFNENWVIRVYNATDLNQIIAQLIEGDSFELNTSSWKPGVYIICAYIGDKLYTAKITVK